VESLGGKPTPGVGFGSGLERLLIALEAQGVTISDPRRPLVWIVTQSDPARDANLKLITEFRAADVPCDMDATGRSLKSQFKLADRENAAWCIIVGDQELSANTVMLKNLKTGEQAPVARNQIVQRLQGEIGAWKP
jgi:histidyl-tRNA synthetase